jgi:DUF1365 family protein
MHDDAEINKGSAAEKALMEALTMCRRVGSGCLPVSLSWLYT